MLEEEVSEPEVSEESVSEESVSEDSESYVPHLDEGGEIVDDSDDENEEGTAFGLEGECLDGAKENKEAVRMLNERLGITDKESLFSFDELKKVQELINESKAEFKKFSEEIADGKAAVEKAEKAAGTAVKEAVSLGEAGIRNAQLAVATFEEALGTVTSLTETGISITQKLYAVITSTDMVDPDVIEATAKIIEGVRVSVADIIAYNTQKLQLEHQYRLAMDSEVLKQKHRMELECLKSKLRIKEMHEKDKIKAQEAAAKAAAANAPSVGAENLPSDGSVQQWSFNEVLDALRKSRGEGSGPDSGIIYMPATKPVNP